MSDKTVLLPAWEETESLIEDFVSEDRSPETWKLSKYKNKLDSSKTR